jgi:hypothetical protein
LKVLFQAASRCPARARWEKVKVYWLVGAHPKLDPFTLPMPENFPGLMGKSFGGKVITSTIPNTIITLSDMQAKPERLILPLLVQRLPKIAIQRELLGKESSHPRALFKHVPIISEGETPQNQKTFTRGCPDKFRRVKIPTSARRSPQNPQTWNSEMGEAFLASDNKLHQRPQRANKRMKTCIATWRWKQAETVVSCALEPAGIREKRPIAQFPAVGRSRSHNMNLKKKPVSQPACVIGNKNQSHEPMIRGAVARRPACNT